MRKREASLVCASFACLGLFAEMASAQSIVTASSTSTSTEQGRTPARLERPTHRIDDRAQYYTEQTWSQLTPWATRHQVPVLGTTEAANRVAETAETVTAEAVSAPAQSTAAENTTLVLNANARFGFSDPSVTSTSKSWFYDYYVYDPVIYTAPSSDIQTYRTASRYHDLNNDGLYDRISNFRDIDYDGSYDVHEHLQFAAADIGPDEDQVSDGPHKASRHTVNGTIDATKFAKVNGVENLVVRIGDVQAVAGAHIDTSMQTVVDLGPAARWPAHAVKGGDQLTASGPIELLGDKQVLIAETATIGNQKQTTIVRARPRLEGKLVDVTHVEVQGVQHTVAILDSAAERQIVDFGPAERLTFDLEPGMRISVEGMPVRIQDRRVILADRIHFAGQQLTVQRW